MITSILDLTTSGNYKKKQYFSYILSQFYWWRNSEYPEETTDLPQVTDKLYHIIPERHSNSQREW